MSLDRDQRRFVALGKRLYGDEGWQREFARVTGLSHQLVSKIAAGDRAVTDAVRAKVIAGLRAEVERLRERAIGVLELLREYDGQHSAEKRSFGRGDIRWMPTIDGKVMAFGKFPFGGYATRREAVAAAKIYQEFGADVRQIRPRSCGRKSRSK